MTASFVVTVRDRIVRDALRAVGAHLGRYKYTHLSEADLQAQIAAVLPSLAGCSAEREVISSSGRYDLLVFYQSPYQSPEWGQISTPADAAPVRLVLELKTRCAVAAVERQAQRYAMTHGVDAVMVATTSRKLAAELADLRDLGGKPFAAVGLRSW